MKRFIVFLLVFTLGTCAFAQVSNDAKFEYNQGVDYYKAGMYDKSMSAFKRAIELDANYIDAYYNLGSILEYLKQDEAALNVFKQIILRKPDDYESVYKAALLSKKVGEYDKAKMYLTLIPTDSLIGARAKQLADSLNTDIPTAKEEQVKTTNFAQANPENDSHGMYNDISSPTGVATDNNGNLFVAGFSDNTIYKIGPDNKKIVYIKSEKIDGPIGIAVDDNKNLYIANYNKDNILKVDPNGQIIELINNVSKPYCLHITGDLLFISSQGNNAVVRYKLSK